MRYEAEFEGVRLVVEARPEHWQAFVYDPDGCEVLYTAERPDADAAKLAILDFAAVRTFGPAHGLDLKTVAEMLLWEPS